MSHDKQALLLVKNDVDYILFKLAIALAETGLRVWFISVKPFDKVPNGIQQPCKEILQLITFIYINDYVDLIEHLNGIQKWKHIPSVVILKNLEHYSKLHQLQYDSRKTAFLMACLIDSVSFLSKKLKSDALLVVSCSEKTVKDQTLEKRLKVLHDMYLDNLIFQDDLPDDELVNKIKGCYYKNKTAIQ